MLQWVGCDQSTYFVCQGHMHLEADLGRDAGALDQLGQCERCVPFLKRK